MSEPVSTVTLTIDGRPVTVDKGTNVLEAARKLGIDISAFCYHPGLSIAACCRQCLVSVEKSPKLQPSCQQACGDGMVVRTADPQSTLARKQMLEFTLLNHPIDCPICDKAGECTLQKLYFEHDAEDSRVDVPKVEKPKAVDLGPTVVLDAERCILCSRCIRVCDEVAHEHELEFSNRGDHQVLGTAPGASLKNPYSVNTVDVCPVGALTAKDFRFTMRAWELDMTPSVCNGCATGCNIEVHHKNERAWRLVPRHNPDVNKYWMCDEGRLTYHELRADRIAVPMVGGLPSTWQRALDTAARKLGALLTDPAQVAVVFSAQASNEENYALAKLAAAWRVKNLFIAASAPVPDRADDILRDADVNANTAGVKAIAGEVQPLANLEAAINTGAIRGLVVLGHDLPLGEAATARLAKLEALVVLAWRELGPAAAGGSSTIVLPVAAWAEIAGTITNRQGFVQRMHPAFPPPGQAIAGWEAVVRLSNATGVNVAWTHARDVFKDMVAAVPAFSQSGQATSAWGRETRPVQLRFAYSRG